METKCEFCKYWINDKFSYNNGWKLCLMSKNPNSKLMKSGCGLRTTKDFSCACFELKKPING